MSEATPDTWRRFVHAVGKAPGLRRLKGDPAQRPFWPVQCAVCVDEPVAFVGREYGSREVAVPYRLRGTEVRAFYRHPQVDLWILDEIFYRGVYEPPAEVTAAIEALGRPPVIADVGAHIGLASAYFLGRWPQARVIAFEPSRQNREVLERTVALNGLGERFEVVAAFASNAPGEAAVEGILHLTRMGEVQAGEEAVPVVDVFERAADADLVKMDVQGAEWPILTDPRLADLAARVLVIEFHPAGAPSEDPGADVLALVRDAGYTPGPIFDEHFREGTVWAWRE